MKKIKIKVPATSANLGPGFDFLGIALNLYNEFIFEEAKEYIEIGFEGIDNNMVLASYKYIINKYYKKDLPISIKIEKNDIPSSHGLGSSASAIVSGMLAANYFLNNLLSEKELIKEMIEYEGHPDNVMACLYGGLASTVIDDDINIFKYDVANELYFNVLIPSYNVKTSDARCALPKTLTYSDVTSNASRVIMLPKAFEKGDINLLKILTKDEIHEKYRSKFIKEWDELKVIAKNFDVTLNISGSGPTMLIISKNDEFIDYIKDKFDFRIIKLKVCKEGAVLTEL